MLSPKPLLRRMRFPRLSNGLLHFLAQRRLRPIDLPRRSRPSLQHWFLFVMLAAHFDVPIEQDRACTCSSKVISGEISRHVRVPTVHTDLAQQFPQLPLALGFDGAPRPLGEVGDPQEAVAV